MVESCGQNMVKSEQAVADRGSRRRGAFATNMEIGKWMKMGCERW